MPGVDEQDRTLRRLARVHGILPYFVDHRGARRDASQDTLLAALQSLDVDIHRSEQAASRLREDRLAAWLRMLPPVAVVWRGEHGFCKLRLPESRAARTVRLRIRLEGGGELAWDVGSDAVSRQTTVEGLMFATRRVPLPLDLPIGVHSLEAEMGDRLDAVPLVCAPPAAFREPAGEPEWGVFAPVYSLRSNCDRGVGSLRDLSTLARWTRAMGGSITATLPLTAAFLDEPADTGPYRPVSRRFWNELYLDIGDNAGPSLSDRAPKQVVHAAAYARLKEWLARRSSEFFEGNGPESPEFQGFLEAYPRVEEYAGFRAARERFGADSTRWPETYEGRVGVPLDVDPAVVRRHVYSQWAMSEQMRGLSGEAALCLDFPLGVHPDGYDVWRDRGAFAAGVSAGAPPDDFFAGGQDWGIPPLDPRHVPTHGLPYLRECLRIQMRHARVLRIEHVMSVQRVYWVPHGFPASAGAYVRYPGEALTALLCLESHLSSCELLGEDLGTVPLSTRRLMKRRGLRRTFVPEIDAPGPLGTEQPPDGSVAMLNTHDMYPFAATVRGLDIEDRRSLGLLMDEEAERARRRRASAVRRMRKDCEASFGPDDTGAGERGLLRCALRRIGETEARWVLVSMDDLLGATNPQNAPGTTTERPNWSRRMEVPLETFMEDTEVKHTLAILAASRRGAHRGTPPGGSGAGVP